MSYGDNPYESPYESSFTVAQQSESTRVAFLKKVYGHVFGSILALCAIVGVMYTTGLADKLLAFAFGMNGAYGPMVFVFGFMAVSWIAHKMAYSQASMSTQYAGLGIYTVAEAIFLTPIITLAASNDYLGAPELIAQAGVLTLTVFGGLTAVVFFTKADFSFLRGIVVVGGLLAFGAIVASFIFGFSMGIWFSVAMIGLMAVTILWETSEIYHNFHESQYVAAALALFSSIATLFFYILRLLIALNDD